MCKYFQLNQTAVQQLAARFGSPLLVLSLNQVKKNYEVLRKYLPRAKVHYAIKANPHPEILRLMSKLGSNFDVASDGEIKILYDMGIDGERLIYANPVKTYSGLQACNSCHVNRMTFDSASEIAKIQKLCPGATVLLRLRIDNKAAHVDLNSKFGAAKENALALMLKAKEAGLNMAGIAFHVGSQTVMAEPYLRALDITRELFDEAEKLGLKLHIVDIGGGMPIPEVNVKFNLPEMLKQISARLDEDFPDTEIWCEPGRYICGTAVNLITSVIGVTERGGMPWYFLDEGLYGTFSGVLFDQWDFKLITFKKGQKKITATFAGPSCDSLDVMFRGITTAPLELDDLILVPSCGAYTSASATNFNGFNKAKFVIWEDVKARIEPETKATKIIKIASSSNNLIKKEEIFSFVNNVR